MNIVIYGNELYHHGTKGQKWGTRKYQNEDGSYTPLGQQENNGAGRYGVWREDKHSSMSTNHRYHKSSSSTKNKGTSQKTINNVSNATSKKQTNNIDDEYKEKLKKVAKGAAIGAAVALGIGAAFYISSKINAGDAIRGDITLGPDQILQRISPAEEKELHDVFYAAFDKRDIKRYENTLPLHYKMRGASKIVAKTIKSNGEIKIAGHKTAERVWDEVFSEASSKELQSFKDLFGNYSYEALNKGVVYRNESSVESLYTKFFDKLKAKGYSGIIDINDQDISGYGAKAPVILFNGSNNFSVESTKEVKLNIIKQQIEQYKGLADHFVRQDTPIGDLARAYGVPLAKGGALVGAWSGLIVANNAEKKKEKR